MKGTILIVDDERNQREILGSILASEGYRTLLAGSGQEALDALERENVDLVLTDLVMPGMTGEDLIDAILAKTPGTPIILNSAYGTIQTAVEAIKRGAFYYFEKPVDRARLLIIIERAIENLRLKESHRALSVPVNCASLPDSLFESELFGHERGAFTGAVRREIGLFEAAKGGTLILDEIAEVRPETQAKLLRALQDGEIRRVGGKENITVDVRIITATNRDLEEEVKGGRVRADLFYRLNILKLFLPPLRERISDIPALAGHFLARHGEKGFPPVREITKEAMRHMMRYPWPGNIRELSRAGKKTFVARRKRFGITPP